MTYSVQYLACAIVLVVAVCAFYRFKATVLIWMVAKTLLNAQISVRFESPAMSCELATDLILFAVYFLKYGNLFNGYDKRMYDGLDDEPYLFKIPALIILFSYIITFLIAPYNTPRGFNSFIKYFVTNFGLLFLFQKCLTDWDDLRLFMKASIIVVLLQTGISILTLFLHDNLWLNWVYYNSPNEDSLVGRMFYMPLEIAEHRGTRYGNIYTQGFFGIHIAFSVFCVLFFYLFMKSYLGHWNLANKVMLLASIVLLFVGVIISNSKTGYVGLLMMIPAIYKPNQILNFKIIVPIIVLLSAAILYAPNYFNNFLSLFDEELAHEGGGSTMEGRARQFQVGYELWIQNPWFGNGNGSIELFKVNGYGDILGAESVWLKFFPERGLLGALSYFIMYLYIFRIFKDVIGKWDTFFFLIAVLTMETASGIRDSSLWGGILIVAYRYYILKYSYNDIGQKFLTNPNCCQSN